MPIRPSGPARQARLRTLNLELVLDRIVDAGRPISRTELIAATGLTRPTITRIVNRLIEGRLVTEVSRAPGPGAGRPMIGLTLSGSGPAGLGLDIRADALAACVVDLTGRVRHTAFLPRPADVLPRLGAMAADAVAAVAREGLTVVAATLAVPGPVQDGVVRSAPALGWRDVDAVTPVRAAMRGLDLPVTVENEARLGALGELYAGDPAPSGFLYVSGGLGIGTGVVLDGALMGGWRGELGHVTVERDGPPCPCGSRGCLLGFASLPDDVFARAEADDPAALAALATAGSALGVALSGALNLLDIRTVLLGGTFAVLSSWLTAGVRAEIGRRVPAAAWTPIAVRPSLLGPDAAAIGAALTAIDGIRRRPSAWLGNL
ncbi:ROK family transcriptional regulator [Catenuloplanes japonicus]|uniref:ROK family transcriptional regulator n=1 Tax=Catenuloplanes japonicus TaxID=33876 RepID=UPI0005260459|nr:ROK family transcriptional regulator [Catenuloplanes japonicus]